MSDDALFEALGSSDRKFSQMDDRDISDSEGGNDSDFKPKVTESKKKKKIKSHLKTSAEFNRMKGNAGEENVRIKITNRNKMANSTNSRQSRSPPVCTAPKRKAHTVGPNTAKRRNLLTKGAPTTHMTTIRSENKLLLLQQELNKMLEGLSEPIPDSFMRIGTTFTTTDRSYQAPVGVFLNFLLQAAVYEIPTRRTPVRFVINISRKLEMWNTAHFKF